MSNTLKNFKQLAALYEGTSVTTEEFVLEFQYTEDPIIIAYVFCQSYALIVNQGNKFFGLSEEDKESFAVEELELAMMDYKEGKGASFKTFFMRYFVNRLRAETQATNTQKRKANNVTEEYEEVTTVRAYEDQGYDNVEFIDSLETSFDLTENELKYCHIVMNNPVGVVDTDVAKLMGMTSAGVNWIKKSLKKKLSFAI